MTVLETHIRVNQRYQEVASNKRDILLPDEVDLVLNMAQDRLIQELVANLLTGNQLELRSIAPLIVKNKILPTIIPTASDYFYEPDMVYALIPANLKHLVNVRAEITTNTVDCDTPPVLAAISLPEYVAVVPFPAANASAPFYPGFTITRTAGTLFSAASAYNTGFQTKNSKYKLITASLDYFNQQLSLPLQVYWERYRDSYYPDSYIFVSPQDMGTFTVTFTGATPSVVAQTLTNYSQYNRVLIAPPLEANVIGVTVSEADMLYKMQTFNQYYKSSQTEVIAAQGENIMNLYQDESFLITRLYIDYIRKPRTISLALNQSCELTVALPKIIDLAVELLRLDTKDNNYPQTVQDTELRNKI